MNNTPTPRTDEATLLATDLEQGGNFNAVHVQVAQRLEKELTAVTEQLKETQEALAAEIKHHTETTTKWNGHHMDLTITQCDLNTAHRTLKEVTEQRKKYRSAIKDLHSTIQRRMSSDDPTPEDRLAIWSAWKAAGQILEENETSASTDASEKTL